MEIVLGQLIDVSYGLKKIQEVNLNGLEALDLQEYLEPVLSHLSNYEKVRKTFLEKNNIKTISPEHEKFEEYVNLLSEMRQKKIEIKENPIKIKASQLNINANQAKLLLDLKFIQRE